MKTVVQFDFHALIDGGGQLVPLDTTGHHRVILFTDVEDAQRQHRLLPRRDPTVQIRPVKVIIEEP